VKQYLAAPDQYVMRNGPFSFGFLQAGFPAAQVVLCRRALEGKGAGDRRIGKKVGIAWAWAARGRWDSAMGAMAEAAETNPGTYVPRRAALFGFDPVLAVESYGLAVLGAWVGATGPEVADQRRPAALTAIGPLPDERSRADARGRMAWLDGLLGFTRGDRKAIAAAKGDAARSGYSQSEMVEGSLAAFDRALSGDRREAGRALAALEKRCADQEECSHLTPEIAVQRLAAARWLQEAGEIEEAVRLLRWQDARHPANLIVGPVLAGPTFLARARLEEVRGERRRAGEYYRQFLRLYDQPMPSQAHLVEEAKDALAKLGEGQ
jgi:tetratricopeptide (TPR) repeat protein